VEGALRRGRPGDLKLVETFCRDPGGGFLRLPAHLARLARTAAALDVPLDAAAVARALAAVAGEGPLRVRLTVTLAGEVVVEAVPLMPAPPVWTVALAARRVASEDPWLRVKTTWRPVHDAARAALPPGLDEALLMNERGEVADGTITTVFADFGDGLVTPALESGPLPGVLRAELLERGGCREAVIEAAALGRARRLLVGNSLRGLLPARLVEAPILSSGSVPDEDG
jgi:4-amino-4-deoxychorismate lyase